MADRPAGYSGERDCFFSLRGCLFDDFDQEGSPPLPEELTLFAGTLSYYLLGAQRLPLPPLLARVIGVHYG